jgi:hypothetical protein
MSPVSGLGRGAPTSTSAPRTPRRKRPGAAAPCANRVQFITASGPKKLARNLLKEE